MAEQKLQIQLDPQMAEGTYANLAIIAHSSSEFVVDFVRNMPGMQSAKVQSRIILTPEHAKRLLFALQENIDKYENQFGKIQLKQKPQGGGATFPLAFGGGEA
ncbi:MAG: DUF3467 domain-containing protein [Paludibacteraceae bacterium]|nr:DUF3467 domain-containing protein [Paludibacteraceae bacterium]